jgi:hypothetical protein
MKAENSSTPKEMSPTQANAWRRLWERILMPLIPSDEEQNKAYKPASARDDDQQRSQNETDKKNEVQSNEKYTTR